MFLFWIRSFYRLLFVGILLYFLFFFFFQAEDGIRDGRVTGVQTCALPICPSAPTRRATAPSTSRPPASTPRPARRRRPRTAMTRSRPSRTLRSPTSIQIGRASCRERV